MESLPAKTPRHARHYVLEIIVNVPDEYPCVFVCASSVCSGARACTAYLWRTKDKCRARPQMHHSTRGERESMCERKGKREGEEK